MELLIVGKMIALFGGDDLRMGTLEWLRNLMDGKENLPSLWNSIHSSKKTCWPSALCQALCCVCVLSCFSHVRLFVTPRTVASQAPLSMGFSRQEYWSGLPCPPPGDLPSPGTDPVSCLLHWQVGHQEGLVLYFGSIVMSKIEIDGYHPYD